jgi:hypothetical protein
MNRDELLDSIRELEMRLYSPEFRNWVKVQPEENKTKIRSLRAEVISYRSGLETNQLKILADKLDELAPELNQGLAELQKKIDEMKEFMAVLDFLGDVIGLVSRIVTLAAAA